MSQTKDKAKALGAFYTDRRVADFLVQWAVRSRHDRVMDPSFGGGVFLRSAYRRLATLDGRPSQQIAGIEIDRETYTETKETLAREFGEAPARLILDDFFNIDPSLQDLDAIVGNPPFVRYQRFSGQTRQRALKRAAEQNVNLTKLTSSWAPFLVHSVAMLDAGGRLAMVVPFEIAHAGYALPVLSYLRDSFRRVTFLTFRKKLFPELSQDTLLLLAEDKDQGPAEFFLRDLRNPDDLETVIASDEVLLAGAQPLDVEGIASGDERIIEYLIPAEARQLYQQLRSHEAVHRLGDLATVGIGYVTGANDFFHLSPEEASFWGIPEHLLRPAVRRSRALLGVRFTRRDWERAVRAGEAGYLLFIESDEDISEAVRRYIADGERRGVHKAYKCRIRSPWYSVPHVYQPDAFLSYMSGNRPLLVANEAEAVAPNSLHILRFYPLTTLLTSLEVATVWQTSLTRLSTEIEGHALGGGMLKLEPTEATRVLIAAPQRVSGRLAQLAETLDGLLRSGDGVGSQATADAVVLKDGLGLDQDDCRLLQHAAEILRNRRYNR